MKTTIALTLCLLTSCAGFQPQPIQQTQQVIPVDQARLAIIEASSKAALDALSLVCPALVEKFKASVAVKPEEKK